MKNECEMKIYFKNREFIIFDVLNHTFGYENEKNDLYKLLF